MGPKIKTSLDLLGDKNNRYFQTIALNRMRNNKFGKLEIMREYSLIIKTKLRMYSLMISLKDSLQKILG